MQFNLRNTFISIKQDLFNIYGLDIYTQLCLITFSHCSLHSFSIETDWFLYGHFDSKPNTTFANHSRYFIYFNTNDEPWNKEFKHYITIIVPLIQENILYLLLKF